MSDHAAEVVALGLRFADWLDGRHVPSGIVRELCTLVATAPEHAVVEQGRCAGCGAVLPRQSGPGRPRRWCPAPECQSASRHP